MEELLKKLVNLGIGAVKGLEDNLHTAFRATEQGINELIARGDTSGEAGAAQVRKFVNDLLVSVKDYEARAREISENLTAALRELQASGKGRAEELQKKVEALAEQIKSRLPGQS